ncbi:hypothetical protein [Nocardia transvalensis]|uniref:hypothetical protein n=1 Tax=Nocardia transvalensis TaxID=37333 RepID=UPI001892E0DD|nr:hypothetical protein [Nocardia transvalensis]MBF6332399.1 hypothetical protein [Nocardia transvalensis]
MTHPLEPLQRETVMSALGQVPDLLDDLQTTITRTDRIHTGGQISARGRHRERVVPFNQRASQARMTLEHALRAYALRVAIVTGAPAPHRPAAHAAYLARWLPAIPDDAPCIDGIHAEIVGAVQQARHAIDRPVERLFVGPCPACRTDLYAIDSAEVVDCAGCGYCVPVQQHRRLLLRQAENAVGTAAELARILSWFAGKPVTAERIRQWAARGKLHGFRSPAGVVYRIGDVIELSRT